MDHEGKTRSTLAFWTRCKGQFPVVKHFSFRESDTPHFPLSPLYVPAMLEIEQFCCFLHCYRWRACPMDVLSRPEEVPDALGQSQCGIGIHTMHTYTQGTQCVRVSMSMAQLYVHVLVCWSDWKPFCLTLPRGTFLHSNRISLLPLLLILRSSKPLSPFSISFFSPFLLSCVYVCVYVLVCECLKVKMEKKDQKALASAEARGMPFL